MRVVVCYCGVTREGYVTEDDGIAILVSALKYGIGPTFFVTVFGAMGWMFSRWLIAVVWREFKTGMHDTAVEVFKTCSPTIVVRIDGPVPVYFHDKPPAVADGEPTGERAATAA